MTEENNTASGHIIEWESKSGMSVEGIGKLAVALSAAQSQLQHAAKDSVNPHFKSRYADLAAVMDACKGPLSSNGLSFTQMTSFDNDCVSVRTMLMHTSGQYIWSDLRVPVGKRDAQGVGSAITYARRYALSAIVGIAQDDDDGEGAVGGGDRVQHTRQEPSRPQQGARQGASQAPAKGKARKPDEENSATAVMLKFAAAVDSCSDVSDLDEVEDSWSSKIDDMKRGKDYALAYVRVKRAALVGEDPVDEDVEMASAISKMQAKG